MDVGHFYFLDPKYNLDFPDPLLMKDPKRPCFYAFKDTRTGIYWMIPFTSQVGKFRAIYKSKVSRYGKCDTIAFGYVLGYEKAFLIQNMCPVTDEYILHEYIDGRSKAPVMLDGVFEKELIQKASKVLALQRKGVKLIFPDVLKIENDLINKMKVSKLAGT